MLNVKPKGKLRLTKGTKGERLTLDQNWGMMLYLTHHASQPILSQVWDSIWEKNPEKTPENAARCCKQLLLSADYYHRRAGPAVWDRIWWHNPEPSNKLPSAVSEQGSGGKGGRVAQCHCGEKQGDGRAKDTAARGLPGWGAGGTQAVSTSHPLHSGARYPPPPPPHARVGWETHQDLPFLAPPPHLLARGAPYAGFHTHTMTVMGSHEITAGGA